MAGTSSSPSSVDELVDFIASVVNKRYRDLRQPTNGALLAEELRKRFPELQYERLGLLKLSDAVAHGEAKGLVVRNRQVKHLEVLPAAEGTSVPSSETQGSLGTTPHIRPDIWRAFVFVSPGERYVYDRESGSVVLESTTTNVQNGGRFVGIATATLAEQQQWMKEFLEANSNLQHADAPINEEYCFTRFPIWLREQEPGLDRLWKQFRVRRVADRVRQWAKANSIDSAHFFSAPLASSSVQRGQADLRHEYAIRAAITSAARELPIDELQNIAIPIRYVLQALKGR